MGLECVGGSLQMLVPDFHRLIQRAGEEFILVYVNNASDFVLMSPLWLVLFLHNDEFRTVIVFHLHLNN